MIGFSHNKEGQCGQEYWKYVIVSAEMAAAAGPKRTRQTYTRYQTLELEKVNILLTFYQQDQRSLAATKFHSNERSLVNYELSVIKLWQMTIQLMNWHHYGCISHHFSTFDFWNLTLFNTNTSLADGVNHDNIRQQCDCNCHKSSKFRGQNVGKVDTNCSLAHQHHLSSANLTNCFYNSRNFISTDTWLEGEE